MSIFAQDWYLQAVAPGYEVAQVQLPDGRIGAQLPYQTVRRWGAQLLLPPPLTPHLGPSIHFSQQEWTTRTRNAFVSRMLRELNGQLPNVAYAKIRWSPALTYGLPWQILGWQQAVRYTYQLSLDKSLEQLQNEMKPSLRTHLRKAEKVFEIRKGNSIALLHQAVKASMRKQDGKGIPSQQFLERLHQAASQQQAVQYWMAVDQQATEKVYAVIWVLYDQHCAYNMLQGVLNQRPGYSAPALLLWHTIQWAKKQGIPIFDFEGSRLPGVEPFFRQFGGYAQPYYEFTKGWKILRAVKA